MKSMMKDAAILFLITLIAGALLGGVYQVTKDPIARQEKLALENACREVFADAAGFEMVEAFNEENSRNLLAANGYEAQTINGCQAALDSSGEIVGYVLTVTTHEGYGGDIQFTMGIRLDGTLNGISLLSIKETPGLGMQAQDVLVPQFENVKAYPFLVTKNGASEEDQIDAISGATVTSDALTGGVNAGLCYFWKTLAEGGVSDAE